MTGLAHAQATAPPVAKGSAAAGIVLDFDNTMLVDRGFYSDVYNRAIVDLVADAHGAEGRNLLAWHRDRTGHAGVLALSFFGIPFAAFAERLAEAPLDGLTCPPGLAEALDARPLPVVIYSGSPRVFIERVLDRWDIGTRPFAEILAWQAGEEIPLKHSRAASMFQGILNRHGWAAADSWSIGDSAESDLIPARHAGLNALGVGPDPTYGFPWCASLVAALRHVQAHRAAEAR